MSRGCLSLTSYRPPEHTWRNPSRDHVIWRQYSKCLPRANPDNEGMSMPQLNQQAKCRLGPCVKKQAALSQAPLSFQRRRHSTMPNHHWLVCWCNNRLGKSLWSVFLPHFVDGLLDICILLREALRCKTLQKALQTGTSWEAQETQVPVVPVLRTTGSRQQRRGRASVDSRSDASESRAATQRLGLIYRKSAIPPPCGDVFRFFRFVRLPSPCLRGTRRVFI